MMRSEDDKRRHVAALASIALPPDLAGKFSDGQRAVLAIVSLEIMSNAKRSCQKSISKISHASCCSAVTVRSAVLKAHELGLLHRESQIMSDGGSDANIIAITSPSWLAWLDLR